MTENFSNLIKEKNTQVQEVQRVSNKMNPKRPTPRHIIIKMTTVKDKEGTIKMEKRILKASRQKLLISYKNALITLSDDFSSEHFRSENTGMKY